MKLRFFILLFIIFSYFGTLVAQSSQKGLVLEYNGAGEKKPLENVEIVVNNAGSTVSNDNGEFTLQFRTLKPGDKITVRRVEKPGYELLNIDDIPQYIIGNDDEPIIFVMAKTELIREIRNTFTETAHKYYEKSFSDESKSLAMSYQHGNMTKEEFEKKKTALRNEYEEMYEHIEEYIERFARLDPNKMNELDKSVLELINKGKIIDAISLYDSAELIDSYKKHNESVKKLNDAKDKMIEVANNNNSNLTTLKKSIDNQINILWLAGGTDNFNTILKLTKDIADANSQDMKLQMDYAELCEKTNRIDEALEYYNKAFTSAGEDVLKQATVRIKRGAIYSRMNNLELGTAESVTGLHAIDSVVAIKEDPYLCLYDRVVSQRTIASNFNRKGDYVSSYNYYSSAVTGMQSLMELDSTRYINDYAETLIEYGYSCYSVEDTINAEQCILSSIGIYEKLYQTSPKSMSGPLGKAYDVLAELYMKQNKKDVAADLFSTSLNYYKVACDYSPDIYLGIAAHCFHKLGYLHFTEQRYERAMSCLDKSIELLTLASKNNPYEFKEHIAKNNLRKGSIYWNNEDYASSLKQDLLAEQQFSELYATYKGLYEKELSKCASYVGDCYFKLGDYKNALSSYARAYQYSKDEEYLYQMKRIENYLNVFEN